MLIIPMDRKVSESIRAGVPMLAVLMDHRETLLVMLSHSKGLSITIAEEFTAIRSSAVITRSAAITRSAVIAKSAAVAKPTVIEAFHTIAAVATAARYSTFGLAANSGSPEELIALPG